MEQLDCTQGNYQCGGRCMSREWTCKINSYSSRTNKTLNNTVFSIGELVRRVRSNSYIDDFFPPSVDKWEDYDTGKVQFKRYPVSDEEIKTISPQAHQLAKDLGIKLQVYRAESFSKPAYKSASGFYNTDDRSLYLVTKQGQYKNPGGLRETLNHELVHQIQHAIQGYGEAKPKGEFLTQEDYKNADAELREVMKYILVDNSHYKRLDPGLRKAEIEAFYMSIDLDRLNPYRDRIKRYIRLNNK